MTDEVELKLLVSPNNDIPMEELPPLKALERLTFPLINRYFDTPDHQLTAAGIALRLRFQQGQWLQTLKAKGEPRGGLHQRQEFEMPVAGEALELHQFPAEVWPEDFNADQLTVMFETNFNRRQWQLHRDSGDVELVLDTGAAESGDQSSAICEIELELKDGDPSALFEVAAELAEHIPLIPSNISKAERGFNLLENRVQWPPVPGENATTDDWLTAVCRQLEALPDSSADLAQSLQGLAQHGDGHTGLIQSVVAGLASDAQHWSYLPDARALGAWLLEESRRGWSERKAG